MLTCPKFTVFQLKNRNMDEWVPVRQSVVCVVHNSNYDLIVSIDFGRLVVVLLIVTAAIKQSQSQRLSLLPRLSIQWI